MFTALICFGLGFFIGLFIGFVLGAKAASPF